MEEELSGMDGVAKVDPEQYHFFIGAWVFFFSFLVSVSGSGSRVCEPIDICVEFGKNMS